MKNSENYGIQELSAKETKEINGGAWPWYVIVSVSSMAYDAAKGFIDGFSKQLKEEAAKM